MPSMCPGGSPPGISAPVSGVSHRLAIRHAGELLTLSRSLYRWITRVGAPPAGAVTRPSSSVSTDGNRPPGLAAKVRGVAVAGPASGVVVVMAVAPSGGPEQQFAARNMRRTGALP